MTKFQQFKRAGGIEKKLCALTWRYTTGLNVCTGNWGNITPPQGEGPSIDYVHTKGEGGIFLLCIICKKGGGGPDSYTVHNAELLATKSSASDN